MCHFCSKLTEIARNVTTLEKVIVFVGFPGIDGIRSMCQFCSKLPEISRNVKNLQKVIDFVGFPGYDEIRSDWPESPEVLRISKSDRFCGISWLR